MAIMAMTALMLYFVYGAIQGIIYTIKYAGK